MISIDYDVSFFATPPPPPPPEGGGRGKEGVGKMVTRRRREGEKVSSFVIFCHFFQGVEEEGVEYQREVESLEFGHG